MIRLLGIFLLSTFVFLTNTVYCQPPGTIKIGKGDFYIDKTEVTNIAWKEFLYFQKNKFGEKSKEYINNFPDTVIWAKAYKGVNFFKTNSKYDKFPIVGITKAQAESYCKFRSEAVSQIYSRKVIYSLPSKSDYKKVIDEKNSLFVHGVKDYKKIKKNKIYGLCDNVSEILSDENLAFGGDINKNDEKCTVVEFQFQNQYTGFRCTATILK